MLTIYFSIYVRFNPWATEIGLIPRHVDVPTLVTFKAAVIYHVLTLSKLRFDRFTFLRIKSQRYILVNYV